MASQTIAGQIMPFQTIVASHTMDSQTSAVETLLVKP
jgi:hypothetical protein